MTIRYTEKSEIPEDQINDFVEFKEGDQEVFIHKELAESKKAQYRLQGDLTRVSGEKDSLSSKVSEFQSEKDRLEQEAKQKKLDKQKASGQHDEIIEDLKNQLAQSESKTIEVENDWKNKYNATKKDSIVDSLSMLGTEQTRNELKRLIALDISFDDKGEPVVLDESGKATAQTVEDYKTSLEDGKKYPNLVKSVVSQGGQANGSNGGGDANKPKFGRNISGFSDLPKN